MSLILDALNRSRENTDQVPGLATQHYVENSAGGGRRRQYLLWLALLVSLLVIGWLLLDRRPQPSSVADTAMITPIPTPTPTPEAHTAQAAAIVGTPVPTTMEAQESPPVQAQPVTKLTLVKEVAEEVAEEETVAQTQVPQDDSAVVDLYRQHPESEPTAQPVVEPAVAELPNPVDVAEASREEQPIDIEQMVLKARNKLENARLEEHAAPFIADLSQQTKDSIPTIFYERHDYSDDKSQSSVVCNGKSLKVGGSPAAGVKVDEILPDSVVLSYRGTQFRLRALNSWVNL